MRQQIIRPGLALAALSIVLASVAVAQSPTLPQVSVIPARYTWQFAQSVGPSTGKLFVVTRDEPNRRQTCRIQSFTLEKLVCSHAIGRPRTYLPQQVAALILPGDGHSTIRWVLGLMGGSAAAVWGTVALAASCPACAAATGIMAFLLFDVASVAAGADDQRDRLLYLAPGQ